MTNWLVLGCWLITWDSGAEQPDKASDIAVMADINSAKRRTSFDFVDIATLSVCAILVR
jgi:hypothetical protein